MKKKFLMLVLVIILLVGVFQVPVQAQTTTPGYWGAVAKKHSHHGCCFIHDAKNWVASLFGF